MTASLVPCTQCVRHVLTTAPCPFCGAAAPPLPTPRRVARLTGRLGRAAVFVGGLSTSGCMMAAYGGPPLESGFHEVGAAPRVARRRRDGPVRLAGTWQVQFETGRYFLEGATWRSLFEIILALREIPDLRSVVVAPTLDGTEPDMVWTRVRAVRDALGRELACHVTVSHEPCAECTPAPRAVAIRAYAVIEGAPATP